MTRKVRQYHQFSTGGLGVFFSPVAFLRGLLSLLDLWLMLHYKSRTHIYPNYLLCHISGITPKKFLRRPLHPSQELHRCSGIWTSVRLNKSGQFPLPLGSVSCYSCQGKLCLHYTEVPHIFSYINWSWLLFCPPSLIVPLEDAERLPTWLILALSCEHWTQIGPRGSPKQSDKQKSVTETPRTESQHREEYNEGRQRWRRRAFIFLRGFKPSVFRSPDKGSLVLLYFILFFLSRT